MPAVMQVFKKAELSFLCFSERCC